MTVVDRCLQGSPTEALALPISTPTIILVPSRRYQQAEDELDDPRALALPDWDALAALASALVERSAGNFAGWGDVVTFAGCTAARIGEVSGVQRQDIDRKVWMWTVRRQTTPDQAD